MWLGNRDALLTHFLSPWSPQNNKNERRPKLKIFLRLAIHLLANKAYPICQARAPLNDFGCPSGCWIGDWQHSNFSNSKHLLHQPLLVQTSYFIKPRSFFVKYHWLHRIVGGLSSFSGTGEGNLTIRSGQTIKRPLVLLNFANTFTVCTTLMESLICLKMSICQHELKKKPNKTPTLNIKNSKQSAIWRFGIGNWFRRALLTY
jgi:hypothetical protein